uniref:MDM2 proto-oncogene n=1 Tax=Salmo trutta TaxID=8032 RepID=A0A674AQ36_SALTR
MAENCERMSEWHRSSSQINTLDNDKLVRPKEKLHILLQQAGADKDVFTMKEVIFYLGQYIMKKQLYDMKQQHIVHCADDPLGAVLGVDSFSVKEPRCFFFLLESQSVFTEPRSQSEPDRGPKVRRPHRKSIYSLYFYGRHIKLNQGGKNRACGWLKRSSGGIAIMLPYRMAEDGCESRKRHRSDSFSLTFDDSMSWCVIGGLRRDRRSSESSDSHSNTEVGSLVSDVCDDVLSQDLDSDSDNFSVEFEVESIDSDAYSDPEEASVSGEDEVYEVTIFEAEEEDSFDDDTEITEADYWKCSKCEELNPPLPRNCNRCWTLRMDWFPESDSNSATTTLKPLPPKPSPAPTEPDETEGLDVPDGKRAKSPLPLLKDSQDLPSTSSSNSNDLERFNSLEAHLPASCLEPCVICQTRPKNGCIVHGRTGHLMACYTCARKLKKRNKLCPVCREPIQSVVLIYLS